MTNILIGCLNYFVVSFVLTDNDNFSKFLKFINYIAGTTNIVIGVLNLIK